MPEQDTTGIRVFVYGTLKQGHGNHPALSEAEFLGRCVLTGNVTLVDLGWYPGLVRDAAEESSVFGEVYRVDESTLDTLDLIEGHPNFYTRLKMPTEEFKNVWVYTLPDDYLEGNDVVDNGCWRPEPEEMEFYERICADQAV